MQQKKPKPVALPLKIRRRTNKAQVSRKMRKNPKHRKAPKRLRPRKQLLHKLQLPLNHSLLHRRRQLKNQISLLPPQPINSPISIARLRIRRSARIKRCSSSRQRVCKPSNKPRRSNSWPSNSSSNRSRMLPSSRLMKNRKLRRNLPLQQIRRKRRAKDFRIKTTKHCSRRLTSSSTSRRKTTWQPCLRISHLAPQLRTPSPT